MGPSKTSEKTGEKASAEPNSRRAERYRQQKARTRNRLIAVAVALVLVGAVVGIVVAVSGDESAEPAFVGAVIDVSLGDYFINGNLVVPTGEVRLEATNIGVLPHNVGVRRGPISNIINTGETRTLDLGFLAPGTYELYCDIIGHVEQGMVAPLVVTP